jgi:hypothetical protein
VPAARFAFQRATVWVSASPGRLMAVASFGNEAARATQPGTSSAKQRRGP